MPMAGTWAGRKRRNRTSSRTTPAPPSANAAAVETPGSPGVADDGSSNSSSSMPSDRPVACSTRMASASVRAAAPSAMPVVRAGDRSGCRRTSQRPRPVTSISTAVLTFIGESPGNPASSCSAPNAHPSRLAAPIAIGSDSSPAVLAMRRSDPRAGRRWDGPVVNRTPRRLPVSVMCPLRGRPTVGQIRLAEASSDCPLMPRGTSG